MARIALAGLSGQLEEENRARNERIEIQGKYATAEEKDKKERVSEDAQLGAIGARDRARGLLSGAREKWRLYAAWNYHDALNRDRVAGERVGSLTERVGEAAKAVSEAEKALAQLGDGSDLASRESQSRAALAKQDELLKELERKHTIAETQKNSCVNEKNKLKPDAEHWDGRTVDETAAALEAANIARAGAQAEVDTAERAVNAATTALANAREGRGGAAGALVERLRAEPEIPAVATFADIIEVDEDARDRWEPMLHSLLDAVVVPRAAAEHALLALADQPGSQVIVADSLDLAAPTVAVDGIRCPSGLESLVHALQERFVQRHVPTRADDDALGLSVLGKFSEPLVGRGSLIRRAERELAAAEVAKSTAESALRVANAARTLADITHKAAKANARLVEIDEEIRELDEKIACIDGKAGPAKDEPRTRRMRAPLWSSGPMKAPWNGTSSN